MHPARRLWIRLEPYHALVYFAPEVREAFEGIGLQGFWRGYFAGRAAPLGPVGAGPITAAFHGFRPDFVARALPAVWSMTDPSAAIDARLRGVDAVLQRLGISSEAALCAEAADVLDRGVATCAPAGRTLFAANADLPRPRAPHLALWHAATLLREHRGDGHVAALVAGQVGPCEAHVLRTAQERTSPERIRPHRGWTEEDWQAAADRLRERGLLDGDEVSTKGTALRTRIEDRTDILASEAVDGIGPHGFDRLLRVLDILTQPILTSGMVPYPNAMGVPRPDG